MVVQCAIRRCPIIIPRWGKEALKVIFGEGCSEIREKEEEEREEERGEKEERKNVEKERRIKKKEGRGGGRGIEEKELTKRQQRLAGDTRSGLEKRRRVLFHSRSRNKGLGKL